MNNDNNNPFDDGDDITADVGGTFVNCPPGNWIANCYALITLGTIMESYQGSTPKPAKKIIFGFEITAKTHIFDDKKGPEPFVIWIEHLQSFNQKANLRKMVQAWAGQSFSDKDMESFKINSLVGARCMANVILDKNSKGKERAKISTITPVPEGMPALEMINKPLYFKYKNLFDQATFERIPKWIQDKMKTSDEYKQAISAGITTPIIATPTAQPVETKKGGFPFGNKPA